MKTFFKTEPESQSSGVARMPSTQFADSFVDLMWSSHERRVERVSFLYKFSSSALSARAKNRSKGLLLWLLLIASSSCLLSTYYSTFLDHGPILRPTHITAPLWARQGVRGSRDAKTTKMEALARKCGCDYDVEEMLRNGPAKVQAKDLGAQRRRF